MQAGTNLVCYQQPLPMSWCMCSGHFSNLRFMLMIMVVDGRQNHVKWMSEASLNWLFTWIMIEFQEEAVEPALL